MCWLIKVMGMRRGCACWRLLWLCRCVCGMGIEWAAVRLTYKEAPIQTEVGETFTANRRRSSICATVLTPVVLSEWITSLDMLLGLVPCLLCISFLKCIEFFCDVDVIGVMLLVLSFKVLIDVYIVQNSPPLYLALHYSSVSLYLFHNRSTVLFQVEGLCEHLELWWDTPSSAGSWHPTGS